MILYIGSSSCSNSGDHHAREPNLYFNESMCSRIPVPTDLCLLALLRYVCASIPLLLSTIFIHGGRRRLSTARNGFRRMNCPELRACCKILRRRRQLNEPEGFTICILGKSAQAVRWGDGYISLLQHLLWTYSSHHQRTRTNLVYIV